MDPKHTEHKQLDTQQMCEYAHCKCQQRLVMSHQYMNQMKKNLHSWSQKHNITLRMIWKSRLNM